MDLKVKVLLEMIDKISAPAKRMGQVYVQSVKKMQDATRGLRDGLMNVGATIRGMGSLMSIGITAPLSALGLMAIKGSANFEKLNASLKTVTGSQKAATAAMKELLQFAASTPYELEEVLNSYIKLKALGLDPSTESLKSFGNTASAMGKSLDQFIEAVADASTLEFERLKEFGIKAAQQGRYVTFTFQGVKTKVKKDAAEIQKYLKSIGDVQFAGAMEEQMNTLNGAVSNFQDSVSTSLAAVGDEIVRSLNLKEFTATVANAIKGLADAFKALPAPMQDMIIKGGLILTILGPLIAGIGQVVIGIGAMVWAFTFVGPAFLAAAVGIKAFSAALFTTPIGWFLLSIAAIGTAAYLIIRHWEKVKTFFSGLWDHIKGLFQSGVAFLNKIMWPFQGMSKVLGGAYNFGTPSIAPSAPSGPAVAGTSVGQRQKVETGGILRIKIDSEGRPTVKQAEPKNPNAQWDVSAGQIMGGAY